MRSLLKRHHLDPRKGLGQNFLVDHNALRRIVDCAALSGGEELLERNRHTGWGSLTRLLAARAGQVKAVEIDGRLIPVLREVASGYANVELFQGDILALDPALVDEWAGLYRCGEHPVLHHFSHCTPPAGKLDAPGTAGTHHAKKGGRRANLRRTRRCFTAGLKCAGVRSTAHQCYDSSYRVLPGTKVDSATLRVGLHSQPFFTDEQRGMFFSLIRMGFAQKRKTLRNTLAAGLRISGEETARYLIAAGIDPQRRAQTLSLVEWRTLVNELKGLLSAKHVE